MPSASGASPRISDSAVMRMGRKRTRAPSAIRLFKRLAFLDGKMNVVDQHRCRCAKTIPTNMTSPMSDEMFSV